MKEKKNKIQDKEIEEQEERLVRARGWREMKEEEAQTTKEKGVVGIELAILGPTCGATTSDPEMEITNVIEHPRPKEPTTHINP